MIFNIAFSIWDASVLLDMEVGLVMRAERIWRTAFASPCDSQRWDESQVTPGMREGRRKVSTKYSSPPFRASSVKLLVLHARTMWWKRVGTRR